MGDGLGKVGLHLVESLEDVAALARWLGERRPLHALAVDTETTGLVLGTDRVRLVQVGDGSHGWSIPAEGGGNLLGLLSDVLRRWDGQILMHNAKFDVGMLEQAGMTLPVSRIMDTRCAVHLLEPHLATGLKPAARRHVDAGAAVLQEALHGTSWTWETVPIAYQPYWSYAALDTVLTYRLAEALLPRIANEQLDDALGLENAVQWVLYRMERYGAHVDRELARTRADEIDRYVDALTAWAKREYGCSPGSNASVVKVLQAAGFELSKETATGALALDKEVLGHCLAHPLAQVVLERRGLQKISSTYLHHLVDNPDTDDLIHPSINILGARTGRMSMQRPNLQNLPRRNDDDASMGNVVRDCFSTRYGADGSMMMCDFDQIEMRVMADYATEPAMIEAFRNADSLDFFTALARMVYQDEHIVKSDRRRQIIKNAGYATIYGAGVEKFSATAGIPVEQGRWVRTRWDELYPNVKAFGRRVIDTAVRRRMEEGQPYVRCGFSGRRHVPDPGKEYAVVNYLIQGAAAVLFKRKLLEMDSAGLGPFMVVPVHDEIVLDVPNDRMDDVADVLLRVMNDQTTLSVPLTASVSAGPTWGAKEAYVRAGEGVHAT